jgi:hypothetical protein
MSERDSICASEEKLGRRPHNYRHGESKTKLHGVWTSMLARCLNKNVKAYKNYGGRGISVCEEWMLYETFRDWAMANGYDGRLHIDRIDNNGNYRPDNCRFVDRFKNGSNKRNNRLIEAFGERKTLSQWTRDARCMVKRQALQFRLATGWEAESAITTPAVLGANTRPISRSANQ